ncbi:hypothetical protein HDU96_010613 [Phlyctochytrium bullatum]|nr:hypothetical protein HDU96_010613 [Phlyctochytrium bullatum]
MPHSNEAKIEAHAEDAESLSSDYDCPHLSETESTHGDDGYFEQDCDEDLEQPPELETLSELLSATALEETDREESKSAIDEELQNLKTPFCLLLKEDFEGSPSPAEIEKRIQANGLRVLTGIDAIRAELLHHPAVKLFLVQLRREVSFCDDGGGSWAAAGDTQPKYHKWFHTNGYRVEGCKVRLEFINPDGTTNSDAWGYAQTREYTFYPFENKLKDGDRVKDDVFTPFGLAVVPVAKVEESRRPKNPKIPSNLVSKGTAPLLALLKDGSDDKNEHHRLIRTIFLAILAHKDADAIRQGLEVIPIDSLLPSDLVVLSQLPAWSSTLAPLVASKAAALTKRPDPVELASLWRLVANTDAEEAISRYFAQQPDDCKFKESSEVTREWVPAVVEELLMHPNLTEKMKLAVQLRIRALTARIRKCREKFSWRIPEAVFAENKEIEEFLRGDKQRIKLKVPGGSKETNKIKKVVEGLKPKSGLTVSAYGYSDEIEVTKEIGDDFENTSIIVRWRRMEKEIKKLKEALGGSSGTKRKLEGEADEEEKTVKAVKLD